MIGTWDWSRLQIRLLSWTYESAIISIAIALIHRGEDVDVGWVWEGGLEGVDIGLVEDKDGLFGLDAEGNREGGGEGSVNYVN